MLETPIIINNMLITLKKQSLTLKFSKRQSEQRNRRRKSLFLIQSRLFTWERLWLH